MMWLSSSQQSITSIAGTFISNQKDHEHRNISWTLFIHKLQRIATVKIEYMAAIITSGLVETLEKLDG